eukprot:Seg1399.4 transcript_id=Seg1399.4/GoldUCD/mRNA.D3Y31 product="hypothetical protein" protein_id=Seg1399.4/GoldUCD/D3Y31
MKISMIFVLCWFYDFVTSTSQPGGSKSIWSPSALKNKPVECKNTIATHICDKYVQYCDISKSVRRLCQRSCGECRAISPLHCSVMPFGCCWDGLTYATGKNQEGCPACKNRTSKCKKWGTKKNCGSISAVKKYCPESCGLCATCEDEPKASCSAYKKRGFCQSLKSTMKVLCKKTCNLCNESCRCYSCVSTEHPRVPEGSLY